VLKNAIVSGSITETSPGPQARDSSRNADIVVTYPWPRPSHWADYRTAFPETGFSSYSIRNSRIAIAISCK